MSSIKERIKEAVDKAKAEMQTKPPMSDKKITVEERVEALENAVLEMIIDG